MKKSNSMTMESILFLLILLLLFLGSLNNVGVPAIKLIGFISLLLSLFLGSFLFLYKLFKSRQITKIQFTILFSSIPFTLFGLSGLVSNTSGVTTFLQSILLIFFMLYFSTINLTIQKIRIMKFLIFSFILFHFIVWISTGFSMFFESIYSSSNLIGAYLTYTIIFLILIRQKAKTKIDIDLAIGLSFLIVISSSSRAVLLVLFAFLLVYFLWPIIIKSKLWYKIIFIITMSLLFLGTYIYIQLPSFKYFYVAEEWMLNTFNKSLMSGRERIWVALFDVIANKPILGYGTGIVNGVVSSISQSSHNLYIQLLVQTGIAGLLSFLLFLYSIWSSFWKNVNHQMVRISAATFIATLVYQCFEITLTQNIVSMGALQFCIIGFGLRSFKLN